MRRPFSDDYLRREHEMLAAQRGVGLASAKVRGLKGATYGGASRVKKLSEAEKQAVIDQMQREGRMSKKIY